MIWMKMRNDDMIHLIMSHADIQQALYDPMAAIKQDMSMIELKQNAGSPSLVLYLASPRP